MGNKQSLSSDQMDDNQNTLKLQLNLNLDETVKDHMKPLLNWSLEQIRSIYAPFRKRKGSPIFTRSQFLRFIRLSRITSFHIFDKLCSKKKEKQDENDKQQKEEPTKKEQPPKKNERPDQINAFEVMAILILTSYTTLSFKIQFMFNVFDLNSNKILKFRDLILMFKSIVRGFVFLTNQQQPDMNTLERYAQLVFSKADLNNDQNLELSQILGWIQETPSPQNEVFKRFQPKAFGKQEYHIFNSFTPYKEEQIEEILARINKVHYKEKITNEEYMLLKPLEPIKGKENIFNKYTNFSQNNSKFKDSKGNGFISSISQMKASNLKNHSFNQSFVKLPACTNSKDSWKGQSSGGGIKNSKKIKFNNIIIIKGRTITKKQIFDLREYFDKLSVGKQSIIIEDFIESFSQQKYNHMKSVAASLYNFLDHDQNGRVTFKELLLKIYPNLSLKHLEMINGWSEEYNSCFNVKNKVTINRKAEEAKKRVLPKICISRFKEMFNSFDKEKKGYITLQDMRKILSEVCSEKQIIDLFEESDKNADGKLSLVEFTNVILPIDLEIEGLQ